MEKLPLPKIHLTFFVQRDKNENKWIFNQKLFRNFVNRFSIESTKVDIQFRKPTELQFNLDEEKVRIEIYKQLSELAAQQKLENLHVFYFGRYWRELDQNFDLKRLDELADHINFSAMEMRKYGEILDTDMLKFYSGYKHHQISLNDSMDEFYDLSIQTKKNHIPLHQKMDFVKFGSFLATRNSESNEAINIINQISLNHISRFDIGFIMGDRKIDVSDEALDEIESQTGLKLNRSTTYNLFDCYMKTSVVRYQKLKNGARSMFDSKRIKTPKREDTGTEEEMSRIYQNADFERQEIYAMVENVIKHPEVIYTENFKHYKISATTNLHNCPSRKLEQNFTEAKMKKEAAQKVRINESENIIYDIVSDIPPEVKKDLYRYETDENSSTYDGSYAADYAKLPMDRYGSTWGSYYHDHPYVGRVFISDSIQNKTPITKVISTNLKKRKKFVLDEIQERKKARSNSIHLYRTPYKDKYEMQSLMDDVYFDTYVETYATYEKTGPIVRSRIQKWSFRVNKFFQRTRTLRNIRLFWQQILVTIFFISGLNSKT